MKQVAACLSGPQGQEFKVATDGTSFLSSPIWVQVFPAPLF